MKTPSFIILFSLLIFTSISCKKKKCNAESVPVITGNTELYINQTLSLTASGKINDAFDYEWSGPNGFSSYGETIELKMTSVSLAGEYKVKITDTESCSTEFSSVNVTVQEIVAPCTIATNSFESPTIGSHTSLYVSKGIGFNDKYTVNGSDVAGEIKVEFSSSSVPEDGVYDAVYVSNTSDLKSNEVLLTYFGGMINNHYAQTGKVFVKTVNGLLNISYCSLTFTGQFTIVISANLQK